MRVARVAGWTLITAGVVVLLYVVHLLFVSNLHTDQAQRGLAEAWATEVEEPDDPDATPEPEEPADEPVDVGEAYAALWFERPGSDEPVVRDGELYVVSGVTPEALRRGPGHYPDSSPPGGEGNFAVAGHRTTYGAPFYHLDELVIGDEVHVVGRDGRHWRYVVRETMVVSPDDTWVVGPDPLGDGLPLLTLTTCHPRFSAAQRYVVFAGLDGEVTG